MFSWWVWLLIWGCVILGGGLLLYWRIRRLWRELRITQRLVTDTSAAMLLFEEAAHGSNGLRGPSEGATRTAGPFVPAILADRGEIARQARSTRAATLDRRRARRAARRPPWAHDVD